MMITYKGVPLQGAQLKPVSLSMKNMKGKVCLFFLANFLVAFFGGW